MARTLGIMAAALLTSLSAVLAAEAPRSAPPAAPNVRRFASSLTIRETTDEEAFAGDLVFELTALPDRAPADVRVAVRLDVTGTGAGTTLKLFRVEPGNEAERFITETTLTPREKVALFVFPDAFFSLVSGGKLALRVRQMPSSGLTVRTPEKGVATLAVTTGKHFPLWTLEEILAPIWSTRHIVNETGLPVSENGEPASTKLLFKPAGKVTVRNYTLDTTYREGPDYVLDGSTLRLTEGSSIPFLTRAQLFPENADAEPGTMATHKGGLIAFGEGTFFWSRQLAVSYTPAETWNGPVPTHGAGRLPHTRRLLQDGDPLKILLFGDSISVGASASGRGGRPPYVPGWGELLMRGLRQAYKSPITFVNPSKGGGSAGWGLKIAASSVAPEKPDLCILGFGMNDGRATPVDAYISNLKRIMALVRAERPDTEFILVASWMPNADWRPLAPMDGYLAALKELETESVAVADIWSVSGHLLKTKRYCDISSNHVNHPSDFMVRIYAQVAMALLGPGPRKALSQTAAALDPALVGGVEVEGRAPVGDPKVPFQPAKLIHDPASTQTHSRVGRTCTGVPSLAISRGGRMWAAWYSGTTPGEIIERCPHAYVVVATSGDGGETWREVLAIDPDGAGPGKAYDPLPWVDPTGTLWIVWHDSRRAEAWAVTTTEADSEAPSWSKPRRITTGVMMNKPTVLSSGEWLFPVVQRITGKLTHLRAMVSRDKGETFVDKGALEVSYELKPIEPMIVERKNGPLWMLVRTSYGIGESVSRDGGTTWSPLTPSAIKHCTSRFFITRLQSGSLLLVKHGPVDVRTEGPTQRRELMAFISTDDGATWTGGLMLDERAPVSYPDGQQTPGGFIHIIWDYHRSREQTILTTHFTEADVLAGSAAAAAKVKAACRLVSKGGVE